MNNQHQALSIIGGAAWVLARIVERWPLILVAAFFLSPVGPHLRISGTYKGTRAYPIYLSCSYLGARGGIRLYTDNCPIIAWIDSRDVER